MRLPSPEIVAASIRNAQSTVAGECRVPRLLRLEFPIDSLDPLAWLEAQPGCVKTYWADRTGTLEMAGTGCASLVTASATDAFRQMADALAEAPPEIRYYGGIAFAPADARCDGWDEFGRVRFLVPRFELLRRAETGCCFAINFIAGDAGDAEVAAAAIRTLAPEAARTSRGLPPKLRTETHPARAEWNTLHADALAAIAAGAFDKVVLARTITADCAAEMAPLSLLRHAATPEQQAFRFCFQVDEHDAFLGVSPERLYRRTGRRIESEAVAGTRPRGSSAIADTEMADELIKDDKERREHAFVVEGIRRAFDALCIDDPERRRDASPEVVKLHDCQHLAYRISGNLRDTISDSDIVACLHPTAAVGGYPTEPALDWLATHEPVSRGWYAGPVGWVGAQEAEFAVAIRSARVRGARVSIYGGAGIVSGSDAEREWYEIDNKTALFTRLFC